MSWLGNGIFQLNNGVHTGSTVWQQDAVAGTKILASRHDYLDQNVAEGLQNCYTLDSQTVPTANLAMGGFKITGINVAITARSDVTPVAVLQDGGPLWLGTAGGTADALTFSLTPAITAYVAGQTFRGITGASTNTTTATVAINGLTATAIRKITAAGKVALVASDIPISSPIQFVYDGTNFVITSGGSAWGPGSFTTLTASSTVTLSPANANVVLSPTGSGIVTINPATAGAMNNVIIGASTPLAATVTTFTATGAVTMSPASLAVTISPSGTGTVTISPVGALTINPTAASTINNASIGVTTAAAGKFTTLTAVAATGTPQALTDQATVTWDMNSGINATLTIGGNRTLGAPSNAAAGMGGSLVITQDGTGTRTLSYNAVWLFPGGTDPALSTAAGSVDILVWYAKDSTHIIANLLKAFA